MEEPGGADWRKSVNDGVQNGGGSGDVVWFRDNGEGGRDGGPSLQGVWLKTLHFPLAETRVDGVRAESISRTAEQLRFGDKGTEARLRRDCE